jgi:hypothetical protein
VNRNTERIPRSLLPGIFNLSLNTYLAKRQCEKADRIMK